VIDGRIRGLKRLALSLALTGCASAPLAPVAEPRPLVIPAPSVPVEGSIYAGAGSLALFEDQKARRVGDVLTVLLVERTDAKKQASTNTSKETEVSVSGPTLLGRPVTVNGVPIFDASLSADRNFTGSGDSSQSNQLSGSVSVIVTQVLANGNLVISGQKQLQINQGFETVSIDGIVRPADILASNSVTSDRVADARISYAGSGALADSNAQGWLARFFTSPWFPF